MPPSQPNNQNDPYGFIMNPEQPESKPPLSNLFGGNQTIQRAVIVGLGFVILVTVAIVLMSFLNKSSNEQNLKLLELAQTQSEIVRTAEVANEKVSSSDLRQIVSSTKITVSSSLNETKSSMEKRGKKHKDEQLSQSQAQMAKNDTVLTEAEANSNFNEAYEALLSEQLDNYIVQLENVYNSGNQTEKDMVSSAFEQVKLIKEQLNPTQ